MDVSPLFTPFSGRAGIVTSNCLCADSCRLWQHGAGPALPPLKVPPLVTQYFQLGRKSAQANNFHQY